MTAVEKAMEAIELGTGLPFEVEAGGKIFILDVRPKDDTATETSFEVTVRYILFEPPVEE